MNENKHPAMQLVSKVYTDDGELTPSPDYAVITCTQAQAHRIITRLQTAAAMKAADPESFFSYKTWDGVAEFIPACEEAEEVSRRLDLGGEFERVPAGEFMPGEQVAEASKGLGMSGHLAEYSDEGVRFVAYEQHSGNGFWTPWIPAAEFEEAAGGPLTDKVVLLSVSYEGLNKSAFVADGLHDETDSEAEILKSVVASKFEDLRDSGFVTGSAVDFI